MTKIVGRLDSRPPYTSRLLNNSLKRLNSKYDVYTYFFLKVSGQVENIFLNENSENLGGQIYPEWI